MCSHKSMIFVILLMSVALLKSQESETMVDMTTDEMDPNGDPNGNEQTSTQISTESPIDSSSLSSDSSTDSSTSSSEDTTDDSTDSSTSSSEDATSDSTDSSTIEISSSESESSNSYNSSESLVELNGTESQNVMASEYSGFDQKQSLNGSEFSCFGRSFGQYADVDKYCRVFHLCYPFFNSTNDELLYQRITFLCDDESVFDQKRFICVDNSTLDHKCSESPLLYQTTNQEYLIKVFSQNVSPIDEVNGKQTEDSSSSPSPSWFNWLYSN